ncbi:T9SS type A sorting domain-containing protein [Cryomorpha ignava]|uniref:T9SS type A sorting domain-containing protein n=1 Tax=Cryomorpha ignava TaxID=101383 RepID=A0A7K3WXL7_9FLAO|nr:T9SS type A sorting domain-containing protein [Cryomorpha ignava]NEN25851.1 T9SS type A sorting domain-containing protein [Cryomorpha ignava]
MRILIVIGLIFISQLTYSQITFQKTYGDIGKSESGEGITQLSNGDYIICSSQKASGDSIIGNFVGEGVIRRLDVYGNELWTTYFSDPNSPIHDLNFYNIIKTLDGNLVVTGLSDYGYENDDYDAFLAKIDIDGQLIWQHNYGGSFAQFAKKVIETSDGGFLMVGVNHTSASESSQALYAIKTNSFGILEWEYTQPDEPDPSIKHRAYSVTETSDGHFIIAGNVTQTVTTPDGIYIVCLDSSGGLIWDNTFAYFHGQGRDVFIKANGNILVCGWYAPNGFPRPLVIELDANGMFLNDYEYNYNDDLMEWAYSFYKDESDMVTMLSFDYQSNYRITQIDNNFDILWSSFINYSSATFANGNHITKTNDNGFAGVGTSMIEDEIVPVAFKVDENGVLSTPDSIYELNRISIYPNPTSNLLFISIQNDSKLLFMKLFDLNGKLIKQFQSFERRLDISEISSGQYFLKVEIDNSVVTEKIIIK